MMGSRSCSFDEMKDFGTCQGTDLMFRKAAAAG